MRLGIDGRKIPEAKKRGGVASLDHARELGLDGLFYRTVLDVAPSLDPGELKAIRQRADELGLYIEMGLGKVNPYALPETPEMRAIGDGDTLLGFRRMMEACAAIDCRELWVGTANHKDYPGRFGTDRFRTDVDWADQLAGIEKLLLKLKPIALDLGIHINIETHEEITSFEVVRLVEACGPEAFGIVYDTNNGLQRLEHPVWVAKRVAPYTRQTHFKDSGAIFVGRNVGMAWRPCGKGVVDFAAILTILAAAQPELNITIENSEPFENGPKLVKFNQLELAEPAFIEAHPDVTVEEYADFVDMVHSYEKRHASGEVPMMEEGVRDFDYAAAVNDILYSRDHLRGICETLNLPLRKLVA